jgi:hypothetical protein
LGHPMRGEREPNEVIRSEYSSFWTAAIVLVNAVGGSTGEDAQ